jgi:hypothetical protein
MTSAAPAGKPGFFESALSKLVARSTTVCAVIGLGHRVRRVTLRGPDLRGCNLPPATRCGLRYLDVVTWPLLTALLGRTKLG